VPSVLLNEIWLFQDQTGMDLIDEEQATGLLPVSWTPA
jgi:hypothetical protein